MTRMPTMTMTRMMTMTMIVKMMTVEQELCTMRDNHDIVMNMSEMTIKTVAILSTTTQNDYMHMLAMTDKGRLRWSHFDDNG